MKQDTLVTSYYKAYNFFIENQVKILIGLGVVALIIVAVVLISNKRASDEKTASALLAKVMPVYESAQYKEAIDGIKTSNTTGLKSIVEEYGSTEAGETAKILLANALYYSGDFESALNYYTDYGGSNVMFQSTAIAGEAAYSVNKKEYEKAAELYKKAATVSPVNPANASYLLNAGINFMRAGKNDEAKAAFESIKKDYKQSAAAQEVDKYLVQVQG